MKLHRDHYIPDSFDSEGNPVLDDEGHPNTFLTQLPQGKAWYRELDKAFDTSAEALGYSVIEPSRIWLWALQQPNFAWIATDEADIQKVVGYSTAILDQERDAWLLTAFVNSKKKKDDGSRYQMKNGLKRLRNNPNFQQAVGNKDLVFLTPRLERVDAFEKIMSDSGFDREGMEEVQVVKAEKMARFEANPEDFFGGGDE